MDTGLTKVVTGNVLRKARVDKGLTLKEIAGKLGLPNANYLSMIEKGTNSIPVKRLWDFVNVYGLTKIQGLALVKLVNPELWLALVEGLSVCGLDGEQIEKMVVDVKDYIQYEFKAT